MRIKLICENTNNNIYLHSYYIYIYKIDLNFFRITKVFAIFVIRNQKIICTRKSKFVQILILNKKLKRFESFENFYKKKYFDRLHRFKMQQNNKNRQLSNNFFPLFPSIRISITSNQVAIPWQQNDQTRSLYLFQYNKLCVIQKVDIF